MTDICNPYHLTHHYFTSGANSALSRLKYIHAIWPSYALEEGDKFVVSIRNDVNITYAKKVPSNISSKVILTPTDSHKRPDSPESCRRLQGWGG